MICSHYSNDHPHPDYAADDDSFREIWRGRFTEFDHETCTLSYSYWSDQGEQQTGSFDYSGW